jgi:prepilin-type N-terminal cleavage/methylation domain-containing protein
LELKRTGCGRRPAAAGFTLAEVIMALAITSLTISGIVYGYLVSGKRAEWSAYSLAAQSLALQGVEQVRAAKWDPEAWPPVDETPPSSFETQEQLDVPVSGNPVLATNFCSITEVSSSPRMREIRVDCVWMLAGQGPFTNTVITFRSPDQ